MTTMAGVLTRSCRRSELLMSMSAEGLPHAHHRVADGQTPWPEPTEQQEMLTPMPAGDLPHVLHSSGQILKPESLQRADPITSGGLTCALHRADV